MLETTGLHFIEALNLLGVDFVNWGNHEIDGGAVLGLKNVLCSRFPWLAANMKETHVNQQGGDKYKDPSAHVDEGLIGSKYVRNNDKWDKVDERNGVTDSVLSG